MKILYSNLFDFGVRKQKREIFDRNLRLSAKILPKFLFLKGEILTNKTAFWNKKSINILMENLWILNNFFLSANLDLNLLLSLIISTVVVGVVKFIQLWEFAVWNAINEEREKNMNVLTNNLVSWKQLRIRKNLSNLTLIWISPFGDSLSVVLFSHLSMKYCSRCLSCLFCNQFG